MPEYRLARRPDGTLGPPAVGDLQTVHPRDRLLGCLLGGAVGDALGAPIEFLSLAEIRHRFGPSGIQGYAPAYGRLGAVTDDTQMSLFTLEGMIRARVRYRVKGMCDPPSVIHNAYLRWLHTQGVPWAEMENSWDGLTAPSGWLVEEPFLHQRRAPGNTCLSALRSGRHGSPRAPINDSKGCGGVMRAAPVGLLSADAERAFQLGCETAALTHGHPSGWLPAGVLAAAIAGVFDGRDLFAALLDARSMLSNAPESEETAQALDGAMRLASRGLPDPEALEALGGGWVGEEALAIGVCCALSAPDVRSGLLAAVNHSGDSDSTGSIAGNLLGALHGASAIPADWLDALEGRAIIETLASDAWKELTDPPEKSGDGWFDVVPEEWWERYPGV